MEARTDMPGILFQAVARARRQAMMAELTRCGLWDLGNPMILLMLQEQGRGGRVAAQKELSDALHVSPASIAVSLKSLEREGYVEKLSDESDQRRKAVRLTAKGDAAVHRSLRVFQEVDRRMFEGFTDQEREQMGGYLMRMLQNLRGELPPEPPKRRSCSC